MRPYPEEVLKAIQAVMMQHFAPELTSAFNQRELMLTALLFGIAERDRDTAVPDLLDENTRLRVLLAAASEALALVDRDDARAARIAIADLPEPETSLRLSALRRENDALRGALGALAPLIEPAGEVAELTAMRQVRADVYAHLKADATRRMVPVLGGG